MEAELIGMDEETAALYGRVLACLALENGGELRVQPRQLARVLDGELIVAFPASGDAVFRFVPATLT